MGIITFYYLLNAHVDGQSKDELASLNQHITRMLDGLPEQSKANLQMLDIRTIDGHSELSEIAQLTWRRAVKNIDEVAPDKPSRIVFFQSLSVLPVDEYLDFMRETLQLWHHGKISRDEFESVIYPRGSMHFLLAYNFDKPEAIGFLQEASRIAMEKDDPLYFNIQETLTGKSKQLAENVRRNNPTIGAVPIPVITQRRKENKEASQSLSPSVTESASPALKSQNDAPFLLEPNRSEKLPSQKIEQRFTMLNAIILMAVVSAVWVVIVLVQKQRRNRE